MPEFILGDKLPLVSETVIAIVAYAPGGPLMELERQHYIKKLLVLMQQL